jgi:4-amino-4-deoxy-L-arabinose transferase-like glycosyltransferase
MTSFFNTKTRSHLSALFGVSLVCYLPFIGKAFHIDDPLFIWIARQIHKNPFDFFGLSVNWSGKLLPISEITQNPPFASYYIALAAWIGGWSEPILHLFFFLPLLLFVFGTYFLSRKFCDMPFEASLIALAAPVVFVSSSNIMCDIWLVAIWTWAVYFWVLGTNQNLNRYFLISSILVGLAYLTKFFGVNLIFLLAAYTLAYRKKLSKELLYLAIPISTLIGYEWITHSLYGSGQFFSAMDYSKSARQAVSEPFWLRTLVGLSFTGGCFISILFFSPLFCKFRTLIKWIGAIIILGLILPKTSIQQWPPFPDEGSAFWIGIVQCSIFSIGGLGLIVLVIQGLKNRFEPNSILLALWILGTLIFAANINWAINGRSFLPMAPAVGILLIRKFEIVYPKRSLGFNRKLVAPLVFSMALSLWITAADYRMANNARDAAKEFTQAYGQKPDTLFFSGHWGFQYYMEEAGANHFDGSGLKNGDVMIVPTFNSRDFNLYFPPEKTLWKKKVELSSLFGIASMNNVLGAGFYSYSWGPLPFVFGNAPKDQYLIFKLGVKG